jgi:protein-L-isoaspartate(D-aspartate) O-methyltransferase
MLLPVTNDEGVGIMLKVRHEPSGFAARFVSKLTIFHCVGTRDAQYNERLGLQLAGEAWISVQSLHRDTHDPDVDCWLHGDGFCVSARAIVRTAVPPDKD